MRVLISVLLLLMRDPERYHVTIYGAGPGGTLGLALRGASPALNFTLSAAIYCAITTPLRAAARTVTDERRPAAMKPGAYLINTARGPICDTGPRIWAM